MTHTTNPTHVTDLFVTATAPVIWGTTYIVTTQFLQGFTPLTVAMLRALPAGLMLLLFVRQLPRGAWWWRAFLLGALNFSILLTMLFFAAYRLPGGVAATLGAIQPLLVVLLGRLILKTPLEPLAIIAAALGAAGVALLVLTPSARLDLGGVIAGLTGAASMALGTVLNRKWQPPVSVLTFTSWQLTAGGLLLLPFVALFEPRIPTPSLTNVFAFCWLGLIGMALTYVIWLRGIRRIGALNVSSLLLLSPLTAVVLGWLLLQQHLSGLQVIGTIGIVGSITLVQYTGKRVSAVASVASLGRK